MLPPGTEIELWFQDEARVGQKNKITRPSRRMRAFACRAMGGRGVGQGPPRRTISAPSRPISSVRSARPRAKVRAS